jgi:putative acetyltransferase
MHPEKGAVPRNGENDYMAAFAQYEVAMAFSKQTRGAEPPLVLVRQREWIDEPEPGKYIPEKGERITEWNIEWLKDDKLNADSISEFMKHPKPMKVSKEAEND